MTKAENRKKWVEALRSGEYEQGTGYLAYKYSGLQYFCCLGVACELYNKENQETPLLIEPKSVGNQIITKYENTEYKLPKVVTEWLGLSTEEGSYSIGYNKYDLATQNDIGMTFEGIADIIESEPEEFLED